MSVAHSLTKTLAATSRDHGLSMADELAQHFIAVGFAWLKQTRGPRACADFADQLAQDFTGDVIGMPTGKDTGR